MKLFFAAAVLVACSCASTRPTFSPDGKRGFSISCDVDADCNERAGLACGGGYTVLKSDRRFDIWSWTFFETTLLIECK